MVLKKDANGIKYALAMNVLSQKIPRLLARDFFVIKSNYRFVNNWIVKACVPVPPTRPRKRTV